MELPLPCANSYEQSQLQPKSLYCSQSWKNSITYAKYMWKMCVHIAMRYLCSIHIIDAYSSTTTRKMQVHQCIYEGPLQHLGGDLPIYIYRGFQKHKPGAQYTLTTFFIFFLQRPCFNTSQTSQSRPGTPPATPAKLRFGIDSILLFSIELTDISAGTKAGAS